VIVAVQLTLLRDSAHRAQGLLAQIQDVTIAAAMSSCTIWQITTRSRACSIEEALSAASKPTSRGALATGQRCSTAAGPGSLQPDQRTLGHTGGDDAIRRVAATLQGRLRTPTCWPGWVAMTSQFWLPEAGAAEALRVADDVLAVLRAEEVEVGDVSRTLAASVGVALSVRPRHQRPRGDGHADLAMYGAGAPGAIAAALCTR